MKVSLSLPKSVVCDRHTSGASPSWVGGKSVCLRTGASGVVETASRDRPEGSDAEEWGDVGRTGA